MMQCAKKEEPRRWQPRGSLKKPSASSGNGSDDITMTDESRARKTGAPPRLVPVPVSSLPVEQDGCRDCGELVDCGLNAVRLHTDCDEELSVHCYGCRHLLIHDPRYGWTLKRNSREEIAQRRQEVREQHAPEIGPGWQVLLKMRKAA
jgi:hypothetical protein